MLTLFSPSIKLPVPGNIHAHAVAVKVTRAQSGRDHLALHALQHVFKYYYDIRDNDEDEQ
jgi:hypothetical protein